MANWQLPVNAYEKHAKAPLNIGFGVLFYLSFLYLDKLISEI